jgi:hypothetical protein
MKLSARKRGVSPRRQGAWFGRRHAEAEAVLEDCIANIWVSPKLLLKRGMGKPPVEALS